MRWEPECTVLRSGRRSRSFADERSVVEFVVTQLRRIVRLGSPSGSGRARGLRWRIEPFRQDLGSVTLVVVVSGGGSRPDLYVKWVLEPSEAADPSVVFISFHSSDRGHRR